MTAYLLRILLLKQENNLNRLEKGVGIDKHDRSIGERKSTNGRYSWRDNRITAQSNSF